MNNRANGIWMQKKFPDKQQNSLTFPDIPVKNKIPWFSRKWEPCFSYSAPKIWNEIPATIRNAPTVQTFKHQLKADLLRTIIKYDPISHLATARASDSVIYSDIVRVISLHIIIIRHKY